MSRPAVAAGLILLLSGALASTDRAEAHGRSASYSTWVLQDRRARVVLSVAQLELTRLPWEPASPAQLDPGLASYLTARLSLSVAGAPCGVAVPPRALEAQPGRTRIEWLLDCPEPLDSAAELQVQSQLLLDVAPQHLHFVRVRLGTSRGLEQVLTGAEPVWRLRPPDFSVGAAGVRSIGSFLALGVEHIVTGYDHLAFLLALVLLASRLREVGVIATGFTLAHSFTLGLAALEVIHPQGDAVEALIGASIALVAAENVWILSGRGRGLPRVVGGLLAALALAAAAGVGKLSAITLAGLALFSFSYFALLDRGGATIRLRAAFAFVFGLVHGLGFAGVLSELQLPASSLVPALLGFNLGVELGQLAALAVLWPLLVLAGRVRGGALRRSIVELGSAAVCGLGVFWLVSRAYG